MRRGGLVIHRDLARPRGAGGVYAAEAKRVRHGRIDVAQGNRGRQNSAGLDIRRGEIRSEALRLAIDGESGDQGCHAGEFAQLESGRPTQTLGIQIHGGRNGVWSRGNNGRHAAGEGTCILTDAPAPLNTLSPGYCAISV